MVRFKDIIRNDINDVFLNLMEFAETIVVNGKEMRAVIDDMEAAEKQKSAVSDMDGIYTKRTVLYVSAYEFGLLPRQGEYITVQGKGFIVAEALSESGIHKITMEANRS